MKRSWLRSWLDRPMTLRLLPVGFDFYLLRNMKRYKLVSAGPSAFGGVKYMAQGVGDKSLMPLHHSCRIKVIVEGDFYAKG